MALTYKTLSKNYCYFHHLTKPLQWSVGKSFPIRMISSGTCYQNISYGLRPDPRKIDILKLTVRHSSVCNDSSKNPPQEPNEKKPGVIQRFKEMYKSYWYVLLPVHMATSAVWFGSMYYAVRSGIDVIGLLQSLGVSETLIGPLRDSSAGYFALAFALYKMVTPLRYAVTVGGTTYAIKKLTALGLIKPVPSRERIKEMLQEKKEMLQEKKENFQDRFTESKQHYQSQMKEKRTQVMDEMRRYKTEISDTKKKGKK